MLNNLDLFYILYFLFSIWKSYFEYIHLMFVNSSTLKYKIVLCTIFAILRRKIGGKGRRSGV